MTDEFSFTTASYEEEGARRDSVGTENRCCRTGKSAHPNLSTASSGTGTRIMILGLLSGIMLNLVLSMALANFGCFALRLVILRFTGFLGPSSNPDNTVFC
jgi:hypothetical protein